MSKTSGDLGRSDFFEFGPEGLLCRDHGFRVKGLGDKFGLRVLWFRVDRPTGAKP